MDLLDIERRNENGSRKSFFQCNMAFMEFYNKLKVIYQFVNDLDFLFLGRCFCQIRDMHSSENSDSKKAVITSFDSEIIFSSVKDTLNSILFCCEIGNFGDAFILLRKVNEDLLFFLYVLLLSSSSDVFSQEERSRQEKRIEEWYYNELKQLRFDDILKYIGSSSRINEAVEKYGLNAGIKGIHQQLNDYVHSNGRKFYNQKISCYYCNQLEPILNEYYKHLEYIVISFLFFLAIVRGDLLRSTDLVDALDAQQEPPVGSQYWVAPFVTDFLKEHIGVLGEDCDTFLQNATYMELC